MKFSKNVVSMTAIAAASLMLAQAASAQTFVNPDWANHATYIGAAIGVTRANINDADTKNALSDATHAVNGYSSDEKDNGYKLTIGKQLNRNFALEASYFDLGKFNFMTTSLPSGTAGANLKYKGVALDLVTQLPFTERFSAYTRLGVQYAKSTTDFTGTRNAGGAGYTVSDKNFNGKVGLGLEYKFTEAVALRGEIERHRMDDAVRTKANVDLISLGLVWKLGRPAAAPVVYTPPPAPAPVVEAPPAPMPAPAPAPAPAPVPTSEKVSFAAEALFDFNKSVVKPEGKAALDDLLNKLQGMNTEVMVTVGHADSIGSDKYNLKLSQKRAEAVKAYIVSKGVDASRVYTEGKGESQPVADNKTAEGRAKNRRVTVEVVGTRTVNK
ncbi:MAG: OmpA family protein [Massilia sp.]